MPVWEDIEIYVESTIDDARKAREDGYILDVGLLAYIIAQEVGRRLTVYTWDELNK